MSTVNTTTNSRPTATRKRGLYARLRHAIATSVSPMFRHRWKALSRITGYSGILSISALTFGQKLGLIRGCMRVDWNIILGHRPQEIAFIFQEMARLGGGEGVMIEAGCWNGGSTAKFSLMCQLLGIKLQVYDSFQGVEPVTGAYDHWYDYSGEYSASEALVRGNVAKYGCIELCSFHPGWFKDTMAEGLITDPVRFVYIDCDLSKGTKEVLDGIRGHLTHPSIIFSQDYHIPPVREMLNSADTWKSIGMEIPEIRFGAHHTAGFFID